MRNVQVLPSVRQTLMSLRCSLPGKHIIINVFGKYCRFRKWTCLDRTQSGLMVRTHTRHDDFVSPSAEEIELQLWRTAPQSGKKQPFERLQIYWQQPLWQRILQRPPGSPFQLISIKGIENAISKFKQRIPFHYLLFPVKNHPTQPLEDPLLAVQSSTSLEVGDKATEASSYHRQRKHPILRRG